MAAELSSALEAIKSARAQFASSSDIDRSMLGPAADGLDCDAVRLRRIVDWARRLIRLTGPLHPIAVNAIRALPPTADDVARALSSLKKAWQPIADMFETEWREHLADELMSTFEAASHPA